MQSPLPGPEEAKQTQEVTMLVQVLLSPAVLAMTSLAWRRFSAIVAGRQRES